ncbi:hypothetical protein A1F99_059910 [Pyrenophora tritici-repentis]|nr:hypothetical protein A1F99_059910 [Pyrenophora tritici-repentis]
MGEETAELRGVYGKYTMNSSKEYAVTGDGFSWEWRLIGEVEIYINRKVELHLNEML